MRTMRIGAAALMAVTIGNCELAFAQSTSALPIPGYEAAKDVPGAHELPDPTLIHKVVFDLAQAAPSIDAVNPGLIVVARYLNTLAKHGVPADHRRIAVVLHQQATEIILKDAAFKVRHEGHENPNVALIQTMRKAGVDFRVCGQSVLANKIDPQMIMPEIELDLWALTTLTTLELRGYVRVGGGG